MKFEVSERINSKSGKADILKAMEEQFRKISKSVKLQYDNLEVKLIEASFGSINRTDTSIIRINQIDDGYLLLADVHYRPSIAFWIIFIITLPTYIFWLIPVIFYIIQKKTVREEIQNVFVRIKNEFQDVKVSKVITQVTGLEYLEKLVSLKEKGAITEEEFQLKKKEILKQ